MSKKKPAAKKTAKSATKTTASAAPKSAKKSAATGAAKTASKKAVKKSPAAAKPVASSATKKTAAPSKGGVRELRGKVDDAGWLAEVYARRSECGAFRGDDHDRVVGVCGWAFRYRDQGGCVFVDLRDRSGLVQLVFDQSLIGERFAEAEKIRHEFVIAAAGIVRRRTPENVNPKLVTGAVEILVKEFSILSAAETPPFSLEDFVDVHEDIRLKYRYLDLRRDDLALAMRKRSQLCMAVRRFLETEGFLEVETPVLNKSTPEGARDFLVPARLAPGQFFALPQSPQLFKQILMMGGIEKYFQIVKCFRDEDLRADRQPEFTQLDMEMSFVNEEDIIDVIERLWASVIQEVFDVTMELPVPVLSYKDAMERYGVDRPDVRYGAELVDVADIARKSEFKVFHTVLENGGRVKALPVPGGAALSRKDIDELTEWVGRDFGAKGLAWMKHEEGGLKSAITKFFSDEVLAEFAKKLGTKPGDIVFFGADHEAVVHATLGNLRVRLAKKLSLIPAENKWGFVWIRDFPLFERDHKSGEIYSVHHPFTAPREDQLNVVQDSARFQKEATNVLSRAYDLVLNGNEIGGGSIRIHRTDVQSAIFKALGISDEEARERFGFFTEALKYGTPPHGGIAFGIDRVLMLFLGRESIRDVMAFPKTQKGSDLMAESPSPVDPKQLLELGITAKAPAK